MKSNQDIFESSLWKVKYRPQVHELLKRLDATTDQKVRDGIDAEISALMDRFYAELGGLE